MDANQLVDASVVRLGERLRIPVASAGTAAASPGVTVYYASSGDTVSSIARSFGITERQVVLDNDLKNPEYVREGQILRLNVRPRQASAYLNGHAQ